MAKKACFSVKAYFLSLLHTVFFVHTFKFSFLRLKMSQSESSRIQCSIGVQLNERCEFKSSSCELTSTKKFTRDENRCFQLRTGLSAVYTLCSHHLEKYFTKYTFITSQDCCCNPWEIHKKKVKVKAEKTSIMLLGFTEAVLKNLGLKLVPGKLLCQNCRWKLIKSAKISSEIWYSETLSNTVGEVDPIHTSSAAEHNCFIPESQAGTDTGMNWIITII